MGERRVETKKGKIYKVEDYDNDKYFVSRSGDSKGKTTNLEDALTLIKSDSGEEIKDVGKKTSSGCFISTACAKNAGLDDDCNELTVLRKFRDKYLLSMPNGNEMISEYYLKAPLIVTEINKLHNSKKAKEYKSTFHTIKQIVKLINDHKYSEAISTYNNLFLKLSRKYLI